jgi:co-chaperonin GroES (HSP10)
MNKYGEPLGWKVVIEGEGDNLVNAMKSAGLVIPDDMLSKRAEGTRRGKIVAIGPDAFKNNYHCSNPPQMGDLVLFTRYSGIALNEEGTLRVMNDEDIHLVLERK